MAVEDKDFRRHREEMADYLGRTPGQFERAGRAADEFGREGARGASRVGREAKRTTREVGLMGRGVENVGGKVSRWIAGIAVTAWAALTAAMLRATGQIARFSAGMAQVATLLGTSRDQLRGYERQLIDIATRTGVPIGQLTDALYQVVSAGYSGRDALAVLEQSAYAAVAGNTDLKTSVEGVTTSLNAWGKQADQAGASSDAYFVAIKRGVTTMEELSSNLGTAAPLAAQADVELEELLATVSALTLAGSSTSEAMTGLRGILSAVIKPASQAAKEAERLGVQFDLQALKAKGLKRFLDDVAAAADGDAAAMSQLFGEVEALNAVLALTGEQADDFASILAEMEGKAGATEEAFRTMADEATTLWGRVKNYLNAAFLDFGSRVLPMVNDGLESMIALMESIKPPDEQLLDFLTRSGASEATRIEVQLQVDRRRLREEIDGLRQELSGFELIDGDVFGQETITARINEGASLAERSIKELQDLYDEADRRLGDLLKREAEGEDIGFARLRDARRTLGNLEDAIGARTRLNALEEVSEKNLRAGAEAAVLAADATSETADTLGELPPGGANPLGDPEETERGATALREMNEALQLAAASSEDVRRALAAVYDQREELRDLIELAQAAEARGDEAALARIQDRAAQVQAEIDENVERIRQEEELAAAVERTAAAMNELVVPRGTQGGLNADAIGLTYFRQAEEAAEGYSDALRDVRNERAAGLIDEEEAARRTKRATEEQREELRRLFEVMRSLGLLTDEQADDFDAWFQALQDGTRGATEETSRLADTLGSVADGARGVLRLADAFGELDDGVRETFESVVDLADGIAGIVANPADVGSWVQAFGGLVGTLGGLFGGTSAEERREAEQARREAAEQARELRNEIRDNARALRENTDAILNASRPGSDLSPQEAQGLQGILDQLNAFYSGVSGGPMFELGTEEGDAIADQVEDMLLGLLDYGFSPEYVRGLLDQYLAVAEANNPITALYSILFGPTGLNGVLGGLIENLGDYADTVEGQIQRARDEERFTGLEGEGLLRSLLQDLLDNVPDLSAEARGLIEQLLGLDRADFDTQEGYEAAVQALVAELYGLEEASGLSLNALSQMLEAILGFASSVEQAADRVVREATAFDGEAIEAETQSAAERLRDAFEHVERMLRFGATDLEGAIAMVLAAIRDAATGGTGTVLGTAEEGTLLDQYLGQIAGLDLTTQEGQDALAEIIRQMFALGAGALGLDQATFDLMLEQLQEMGQAFEVGAAGGDDRASNAYRVSRQITPYQANEIVDVLRAILYAIRGAGPPRPPAAPPIAPPTPSLPPPPAVMPPVRLPRPPPGYGGPLGPAIQSSDGEWTVVQVRRGDLDRLADSVYPGIVRRMGQELRPRYGHR